jgi:hypothetical protein
VTLALLGVFFASPLSSKASIALPNFFIGREGCDWHGHSRPEAKYAVVDSSPEPTANANPNTLSMHEMADTPETPKTA